MSNQRKIIFLHLPKTGGSALVNILHQYYGLEHSALIAGDNDPLFERAIKQGTPFIHGHFSSTLLPSAEGYFSATLLRNASDRLISRYVHLVHSKESRLQEELASYRDFSDFLTSSYADNWQCRMLSGQWHEGRVNEETYMKAVDRLYEFDWVATAGDQPQASLDLSLKLGFESYYQPRLNVRASQKLWQEIEEQYRPDIADLNRFDQQLVLEASALFARRKSISFFQTLKLNLKQKIR